MVFQSYALYPHLTVAKNIEFPLRQRGVDKEERATKVKRAAETLGLGTLLDRKPAQLSGGQRQRVALARAIVREPLVFLMDEPLSNLDAALRVQTRADIVELQARLSTTTLYVTHDQVEAMTMGHRIAVMSDGKLQQVATPEALYARPANTFVAHFLGSPGMNLIEGMLVESGAPDAGAGDGTATLSVAFPGASVPLPAEVAERGPGRRTRRRARPAPRVAAPQPGRCHRGLRDHRRAARCRDARDLPHRDGRPHHRAPGCVGRQAGAGRGRAHRRRRRRRRPTTSSTPRPASGWGSRDRGDRGGRTGAGGGPRNRGRQRAARPQARPAGPAAQGDRSGLPAARPGAGPLRRLLLLSVLPQLQADAVRDAAGARAPGPLRRAAPDHPDHHLDPVHPEPGHHARVRRPRGADQPDRSAWPWPWRRTASSRAWRCTG